LEPFSALWVDRVTEREPERHRDRETERDRETRGTAETETQRDRETERDRERQRDSETERQRDKATKSGTVAGTCPTGNWILWSLMDLIWTLMISEEPGLWDDLLSDQLVGEI